MADGDEEEVQKVLEVSKDVRLPRGKKASNIAIKEAIIEVKGHGDFSVQATLKVLEKKFGMKRGKKSTQEEQNGSPKKPTKKRPTPSAGGSLGVWTVEGTEKEAMKKLAVKLMDIARGKKIKVPTDDAACLAACGQALVIGKQGTIIEVDEVLQSLREKFGEEDSDEMKEKKAKTESSLIEANTPIASMFREIALIYFKDKDVRKGSVMQKAATAIKNCPWEITLDNLPSERKGPMKLENIGKNSIEKIKEYLETGKVEQLESLKAGA